LLLGQPGDLIAAKTELKITQRLRLDQHKLEDLERKLRTSVIHALSINGLTSANNRKPLIVSKQTKFAVLIASPKIYSANGSSNSIKHVTSNGKIKNENNSPYLSNETDEYLEVKKEKKDNDETDDEDELSISCLISYLSE